MRTQTFFPALGFAAIVAAAPSVRFPERRPEAAAVGTAIAAAVALLLSIGGLLTGPSLFPIGGALFESVVAAVAGGLISLVVVSAGLFDTGPREPA